ncbi:hypothetical protein GCM10010145_47230 [Streptomyces ruber]|uniref:Uncharacterized protein n=2 Tax=Streptomyces TaxID=1883 RepID=A0A918BIM8_9ACTN|nr:hypothetical protein GCM10010145_47230 [Streptomyces ruber]
MRVPDTSVEDWQAVLDLVRSQGWSYGYFEDGVAVRLPRAADLPVRSETPMPCVVCCGRSGDGWGSRY